LRLVGLKLWWRVLNALVELPRLPYLGQILYLFVQIPMTANAAPIAMAHTVLYSFYACAAHPWEISPTEDQTSGGLLMSVREGIYVKSVMSVISWHWVLNEPNESSLPASANDGQ